MVWFATPPCATAAPRDKNAGSLFLMTITVGTLRRCPG
jgi:hypothetical protein